MAAGTELYNADVPPVTARGVFYADEELNTALCGSVAEVLWDDSGRAEVEAILMSLVTTDFSVDSVRRILNSDSIPENWRVGEALAEASLVEHRDCEFPWPSRRDLKNPAASPSGSDLVGFHKTTAETDQYRFAFVEVKTSQEGKWPPSVMNGRHGLKKQLEDLRDSRDVKDFLVKYLGHHADHAIWLPRYRSAAKRYISDPSDVSLFGILVRDVEPKRQDLAKRTRDLATGCPVETGIELRAMYLPAGSISSLAKRAMRARVIVHG